MGVAEEWAQAAYAGQTVTSLHPEISADLLDTLQDRADFLYQHAFTPKPVSVREWLDLDPLRLARAAAVGNEED